MKAPLCIELFCGTFGWSAGWLEMGGRTIGFDIEHLPHHGAVPNGAELVLQDVLTLHGAQFKDASLILASPPCQAFSWRAMPWKLAKAMHPEEVGAEVPDWWELPQPKMSAEQRNAWDAWRELYPRTPPSTALFDACFRIQREASEAAGHHIPMVVENVKGAQPWVGRAQANYGSFYLWGDVRSVGGRIVAAHRVEFGAHAVHAKRQEKNGHLGGGSWFNIAHNTESGTGQNPDGRKIGVGDAYERGQRPHLTNPTEQDGRKVPMNFHEHEKTGKPGRSFQSAAVKATQAEWIGTEKPQRTADSFGWEQGSALRQQANSKSSARKAASAQIARIPFALSEYTARAFKPDAEAAA